MELEPFKNQTWNAVLGSIYVWNWNQELWEKEE
jgi:hypothetical protein